MFLFFLDRALGKNTVVYSTEGGMDIEHVAEVTPHLIHKEVIDAAYGLQGFQARKIAFNLGLEGNAFKGNSLNLSVVFTMLM